MANKGMMQERLAKEFGNQEKARDAIDRVLDAILRLTHETGRLSVTGFGSFERVDVPSRWARNPQNGERVLVPASKRLKFTPGAGALKLMQQDELPEEGVITIKKAPKGTYTPVKPVQRRKRKRNRDKNKDSK